MKSYKVQKKDKRFLNRLLTVDPGNHTGWAYWYGRITPIYGTIVFDKRLSETTEQVCNMAHRFTNLVQNIRQQNGDIDKIVMENVSYWSGSMISLTATTRGDLFKLAFYIGAYIDRAGMMSIPVELKQPMHWKGQLTRNAVIHRVELITDISHINEHEASAIGIGLNEMGIFKDVTKN